MHRLTALFGCLLALAAVSAPVWPTTYSYGFDDGTLQGWIVDGTDLAPIWHITPSRTLPYSGLWSLEYYMVNVNDATKIWIERSYDVPIGHRYDVTLTWKLASQDSRVSACPVIVYADDHNPETHDDPIQVIAYSDSGGSGKYVWLSESYTRTGVLPGISGGSMGKIWVAIGMWSTFEVSYTWYVDSVTVTINESAPPVSIAQARQLADDTPVFLQTKTVSAGWNDLRSPDTIIRKICVEEPEPSAGVMVKHYRNFEGDPVRRDVLNISGIMATEGGERLVKNATISWPQSSPANRVTPVCMVNRDIGGGPFGSYVPGVIGSAGVNNSGLLTSSSGRVVDSGTGYFVIDDGSRSLSNGKSPIRGLAVSTADSLGGVITPALGSYVSVTGISGSFQVGDVYYPIIRLRNAADVVVISPPSS